MATLQLVGPDDTTVLFDFIAPAGAGNPSTVITRLMADPDFGTLQPELNVMRTSAPGGQLLGATQPPVEITIPFTASATTYNNLAAGLGQLARYLVQAKPWSPVTLKWVEDSTTRFMDIIGAVSLPTLLRGQDTAGLVALRKNSVGPITLTLLRQPWMRAAVVQSSDVTVPDDPATGTKVRIYPVTVSGDLPTPGRVRVQMDSGSTVERVLIANRVQGNQASTVMSNFLSETGFAQVETSGRGWTRTLGTDTAGASDASASPGSGTSKATTTFATDIGLTQRVSLTRTTLMDSLRGSWDVWVRVKANNGALYQLQMKWSPAAAGEPAFVGPVVTHDTVAASAFGWVELKLGTIHIPEGTVALSGLQLRFFASCDSSTPDLDWDLVWLVPHDNQGTVVVPGGSLTSMLGRQLTTPPDAITADPTWIAGAAVGDAMVLNVNLEAAGMGPNTGTDLPDGRNRFTFDIEVTGTMTAAECRVTNVTDNTEAASEAFTLPGRRKIYLQFDAVAAKFYQAQVTVTSGLSAGESVYVHSITHEFLASLANTEYVSTDPGVRYSVDRLDVNGNLTGYLGIEGELPVWLEPGLNHIFVRADEVPLAGYSEHENKLARTPTVHVVYPPRYAL